MSIIYKVNSDGIDWNSVARLFAAVEWGKRESAELEAAFTASSHVRFAFKEDELVGFGRTVDDGKYYALIVDLVVSPEYQGMGVGSKILSDLKNSLAGYCFTTLTSAVGKESFYLKQGWAKQTTAFIWPRSNNQRKNHVEDRKSLQRTNR